MTKKSSEQSQIWAVKSTGMMRRCPKLDILVSSCSISSDCKNCQTNKKTEPIISIPEKSKNTLTDYIKEIATEIGSFTTQDMITAVEKRKLPYKKTAIMVYVRALDVNANESIRKHNASIYKRAFLIKTEDGKFTCKSH